MGYTTRFTGELKFTKELTASQLAHLKTILGEDVRDHREWEIREGEDGLYYIQFELTDKFDGIQWDGSEKFYGATTAANVVIREMRKVMPDFGLSGQLLAQGEDADDHWILRVGPDGYARKVKMKWIGECVECPECGHHFLTNGNWSEPEATN